MEQLPILLAGYTFRTKGDIKNYLSFYILGILSFELSSLFVLEGAGSV